MEIINEIWETILFYLYKVGDIIFPFIEKFWEMIAPFVLGIWEKFLSIFCQFGFVCSGGGVSKEGAAILAAIGVVTIMLIFGLKILLQNR